MLENERRKAKAHNPTSTSFPGPVISCFEGMAIHVIVHHLSLKLFSISLFSNLVPQPSLERFLLALP
jgi:hypothetical protein